MIDTDKPPQRLLAFFIFTFASVIFIILFSATRFCHPNCEDLQLALQARDLGIKRSIINMLVDFDGRYFINLLHAFNPLVINWIPGYKLMPIVGILLFVLSVFFFLSAILEKGRFGIVTLLSLFFSAVYFTLNPALHISIYVMIGSFVYLWSWSFTLFWLTACLKYISATALSMQLLWFTITLILLFCAAGTSEMFLVFNLSFMTSLLAWSYRAKQVKKTLPIAVIAVISILFMVLSPGIAKRASENQHATAQLIYYPSILQSVSDYLHISARLLKNGVFICALIVAHPFANKLRFKGSWNNLRLSALALLLLLVSYLMTLVFYIPMQKESQIPLRIFSITEILQLVSFAILFYLFWNYLTDVLKPKINSGYLSLIFSVLLLIALRLSENNISRLYEDLRSGRLENFDQAMNKRYLTLYEAASSGKCFKSATIEPIDDYPETIFYVSDIRPNRTYSNWNRAIESYFKLDEVRIAGDTVKKYTNADFLIPQKGASK